MHLVFAAQEPAGEGKTTLGTSELRQADSCCTWLSRGLWDAALWHCAAHSACIRSKISCISAVRLRHPPAPCCFMTATSVMLYRVAACKSFSASRCLYVSPIEHYITGNGPVIAASCSWPDLRLDNRLTHRNWCLLEIDVVLNQCALVQCTTIMHLFPMFPLQQNPFGTLDNPGAYLVVVAQPRMDGPVTTCSQFIPMQCPNETLVLSSAETGRALSSTPFRYLWDPVSWVYSQIPFLK